MGSSEPAAGVEDVMGGTPVLKILKGRLPGSLAGALEHLGRRCVAEQPFFGKLCNIYPTPEEGKPQTPLSPHGKARTKGEQDAGRQD